MARLSNKTAKIFLSLLLLTTRRVADDSSPLRQNTEKADHIKPEFATRRLEVGGFIPSIAYNGRPRVVPLEENNRNAAEVENTVKVDQRIEMVVDEEINSAAGVLVSGDLGNNDAGGRVAETVSSSDPLERCRLADESGNRKAQIEALVACWDEAFPAEEYPYQRLTVATAKKFLVNRTAEDVGQVILRVGALGHSNYPRSRVEEWLAAEGRRDKVGEQGRGNKTEEREITDELKEYTKWALAQWSKQNENSSRYK